MASCGSLYSHSALLLSQAHPNFRNILEGELGRFSDRLKVGSEGGGAVLLTSSVIKDAALCVYNKNSVHLGDPKTAGRTEEIITRR